MRVGIEAMNLYGGPAYIDVETIFKSRGLDLERFGNLMMEKKAVGLPCEDPVTNGVNAAKPILDRLSKDDRNAIEMVITSSESGLDFGKAMSTYIHDYLDLSRNCKLFEVKQACFGGTAALHMACHFIASNASPGAKVLVIATDTARATVKNTYAEPSQAVGAVAMLVSDQPHVFEVDFGASGYYSYEVMDTCRPQPDVETGDADLSLLSYLDCLENSFRNYQDKVEDAHFGETFDYLAFHTPFGGMVKGAHRKMMRQFLRAKPKDIEADFQARVAPSLNYCVQVGNVYSAALYFALCGVIDNAELGEFSRLGLFSYGSGCSSEFYSGVVTENSKATLSQMGIKENLARRYQLNIEEYDQLLDLNLEWIFGTKDQETDIGPYAHIYEQSIANRGYLVLKNVTDYHREYTWS